MNFGSGFKDLVGNSPSICGPSSKCYPSCYPSCCPPYYLPGCISFMAEKYAYCVLKSMCRNVVAEYNREEAMKRLGCNGTKKTSGNGKYKKSKYKKSKTSDSEDDSDIDESKGGRRKSHKRGSKGGKGRRRSGDSEDETNARVSKSKSKKRRKGKSERGDWDNESERESGKTRKGKNKRGSKRGSSSKTDDSGEDHEGWEYNKSQGRSRSDSDDEDETNASVSKSKRKSEGKVKSGRDDSDSESESESGKTRKGQNKKGRKNRLSCEINDSDSESENESGRTRKGKTKKGKKKGCSCKIDDSDDEHERWEYNNSKGRSTERDYCKCGTQSDDDDEDDDEECWGNVMGSESSRSKGRMNPTRCRCEPRDDNRSSYGKKKNDCIPKSNCQRPTEDYSKNCLELESDNECYNEEDWKNERAKSKCNCNISDCYESGLYEDSKSVGKRKSKDPCADMNVLSKNKSSREIPLIADVRMRVKNGEDVCFEKGSFCKALQDGDVYIKKICYDKNHGKRSILF